MTRIVDQGEVVQSSQTIAGGEPMKPVIMIVGLVVLALGLLFVGQGSGVIPWPARSFMVRQTEWVYYGAAIAAAGLLLVVLARR
jgi:hypothetical protein